jgi:hypothetical protein
MMAITTKSSTSVKPDLPKGLLKSDAALFLVVLDIDADSLTSYAKNLMRRRRAHCSDETASRPG